MLFADYGEPMFRSPAMRRGRNAQLMPAIPSNFGAIDVSSTNDQSAGTSTTSGGKGMYLSTALVPGSSMAPAAAQQTTAMTAPPPQNLAPTNEPRGAAMPQTSFPVAMLPSGASATGTWISVNAPAGGSNKTLYIVGGVAAVATLVGGFLLLRRR